MNEKMGLIGFKFLDFRWAKITKAITLLELMISVIVVSIMVLSFYSLETFSHKQVMSADRRVKVQNQLAYCLEHMGKYVQMASGYKDNPPIVVLADGFKVRVDSGLVQVPVTSPTPSNLNDDVWISYTLTGNTLSTSCAVIGTGNCGAFLAENLTNKIVAGFDSTQVLPSNPTSGFYVYLDPLGLGNFVDVGLLGQYDTTKTYDWTTRLTNPRVAMRSKIIFNNASSN